jgi:CRISPR-associated endonuclease/helicase Cas3
MRRTGSCLVVVNTRASARALYRLCRELVSEERSLAGEEEMLFHLSTDMCPAHRGDWLGLKESAVEDMRTIKGRLEAGRPTLCISTQLIEAGVDVDFGSVVRFLAGIDSIAQAAGRCNRNARRRDLYGRLVPGRVFVVRSAEENLSQLEEIRKAQECARRIFDEFTADPAALRKTSSARRRSVAITSTTSSSEGQRWHTS